MEELNQSIDHEDKELLDYTVGYRKKIVESLAPEGNVPTDEDSAKLMMNALDGIDRNVLGRSRIKADEKANQQSAALTEMVGDILSRVNVQAMQAQPVQGAVVEAPKLSKDIETRAPVPGETDTGTQDLTYDKFFGSKEEGQQKK